MYAIVKFVEEKDAPGIVCTHWINEHEDMCRYPNIRTNEARDRLLQKLAEPANDWTSCRIRILRRYGTFGDAMRSLSKAEETSNLESEEETEERRSRKKIKNSRYAEEDSEGDCGSQQRKKSTRKYCIESYPKPLKSSFVKKVVHQHICLMRMMGSGKCHNRAYLWLCIDRLHVPQAKLL